jgi:hypothetical protein
MNDLHDLMYRASDGDPNRPADPMGILRQGRRRVHRRRGATAVTGVAVAALAIFGGVSWLPSATPNDSNPSQPPTAAGSSDGAYEPVEVSREEVGRRCTILFHNAYGLDGTYVEASFDDDDGPWFEGQTVGVTEAGGGSDDVTETGGGSDGENWRWTMSCEIPQAAFVDQAGTVSTPLPDATDHDGIRAGCGQYLGWDFTGWDVVTSASSDIATTAVLRSSNGYVATCGLNAVPGHQGDGSYVAISREQPPSTEGLDNDYAVWFSTDQYAGDKQEGDYNVFGVDQVSGPEEAAQIVLVEPDGTEHVTDVADNGWFAMAEDLHLAMNPHSVSPLRIQVLDADGDVLADYPDGDQSRECEVYPEDCQGPTG